MVLSGGIESSDSYFVGEITSGIFWRLLVSYFSFLSVGFFLPGLDTGDVPRLVFDLSIFANADEGTCKLSFFFLSPKGAHFVSDISLFL